MNEFQNPNNNKVLFVLPVPVLVRLEIGILLRFYLFWFYREGKGGGREWEKYQCLVSSHMPPTGHLAHNLGLCPDSELNWWPCGSQAGAQSTKPQQPRLLL